MRWCLLGILMLGVITVISSQSQQEDGKNPISEALEKLKSPDPRVSEEGKNQLIQIRKQIIDELLKMLDEDEATFCWIGDHKPHKYNAIILLGEYRAEEAAGKILDNLFYGLGSVIEEFRFQPEPPSYNALIKIGKSSFEELVRRLRKVDFKNLLKFVLSEPWQGIPGRNSLSAELERTSRNIITNIYGKYTKEFYEDCMKEAQQEGNALFERNLKRLLGKNEDVKKTHLQLHKATVLPTTVKGWVTSEAFNPEAKILAASVPGTLLEPFKWKTIIELLEVSSGKTIGTLSGHTQPVWSLTFSPDGKILASGSLDSTIKLWDVSKLKEIRTLSGHKDRVLSVAFSPDGKILASGSKDKTIKIWDVATGKEIRTLTGHKYSVTSVAFSPNGKILASGSRDNTLKLWSVEDGKEIRTLSGHISSVEAVIFSPDGKWLASGSTDCTVKLWDPETGNEIKTLELDDSAYFLALSPDNKILAAGSRQRVNNAITFWELPGGKELGTFSIEKDCLASMVHSATKKILAIGTFSSKIILLDYTEIKPKQNNK